MAAFPSKAVPVALYGVALSVMGFGFSHLRRAIIAQRNVTLKNISPYQKRMRWKNTASAMAYLAGAGFAFIDIRISYAIYIVIPASYFLPDPSLVESSGTAAE
jgi:hypothetical protein